MRIAMEKARRLKEARRLIEDAEWDIKAKDFIEGRANLEKAKKMAKELDLSRPTT